MQNISESSQEDATAAVAVAATTSSTTSGYKRRYSNMTGGGGSAANSSGNQRFGPPNPALGRNRNTSELGLRSSPSPSPSPPMTEQESLDKGQRDYATFQLDTWLQIQKKLQHRLILPKETIIDQNFGHLWPHYSLPQKDDVSRQTIISSMIDVVKATWIELESESKKFNHTGWLSMIKTHFDILMSNNEKSGIKNAKCDQVLFDSPWSRVHIEQEDDGTILLVVTFHRSNLGNLLPDDHRIVYKMISPNGWRELSQDEHTQFHTNTSCCCTLPYALRTFITRIHLERTSKPSTITVDENNSTTMKFMINSNYFDIISDIGATLVFNDWEYAPLQHVMETCGMDFKNLCRSDTRVFRRFSFQTSDNINATGQNSLIFTIVKRNVEGTINTFVHWSNDFSPIEQMDPTLKRFFKLFTHPNQENQTCTIRTPKGVDETQLMSNMLWKYGCKPVLDDDDVNDNSAIGTWNENQPSSSSSVVQAYDNQAGKKILDQSFIDNSTLWNYFDAINVDRPSYLPLSVEISDKCIDRFSSIGKCTPITLQDRPDCVETCDALLFAAIKDVISN